MTRYILDTNHLGLAVRRHSKVAVRIADCLLLGNRVGTCLPAVCEVQAGARQVADPVQYQRKLHRLMQQIRIWPMDFETTEVFGDIHQELRSAGTMMSLVDIMVAALARQLNIVVLTTDHDFRLLPDIKTEDWTT